MKYVGNQKAYCQQLGRIIRRSRINHAPERLRDWTLAVFG